MFSNRSTPGVVETVDKIEKAVRTALPWYSFEIYVEPDIYSAKHVHA